MASPVTLVTPVKSKHLVNFDFIDHTFVYMPDTNDEVIRNVRLARTDAVKFSRADVSR